MFERLSDITQKDMDYMFSHPCDIVEKMNMFKFVVEISPKSDMEILTTKCRRVTDADRGKNFLWNSISKDLDKYRIEESLRRLFPKMWLRVYLFYDYSLSFGDNDTPFVFGHIIDQTNFKLVETDEDSLPFRKSPVIAKDFVFDEVCREMAEECVGGVETSQNLTKALLFGFSLPYPSSYDGIAVRSGKRTFLISDDDERAVYVFTDFVTNMVWQNYINVKRRSEDEWNRRERHYTSYQNMVADEFVFYLEHTDFFKKYKIYERDLLPPYARNYDMDYSSINNKIAENICKCNGTYRAIYKLLYDRLSVKRGPLIVYQSIY